MPFRYTYRAETAWGPTLVLYGTHEDARELANDLRLASAQEWIAVVHRHLSPANDQEPAVVLELVEEQSAPGNTLCQVTQTELKWRMTKGGVKAVCDKLASFHAAASGHHYLDDAGDITVVLSVGEGHSA